MKTIRQIMCAVIALLAVPFAGAVDVDLGGQHRMRGVYYEQNMKDVFVQRFKLVGDFRPNEMFESHFWLIKNHRWSWPEDEQTLVSIYGYGDWKVMDEVMIRLGRNPFQLVDGSSIGVNDYENYPYVWDGLFLTYNTESVILDVWAAHPPGILVGSGIVNQYDKAVGVSLSVRSLPEFFKTANLFAVYALGDTVISHPDHVRAGVSLSGGHSKVDYQISGAVHGADFSSMNQYFVDAHLGYSMGSVGVHLKGHYESDEYDPFYYTRHASAGLLDVAAWGKGAQFGSAGVSYSPVDDFEVGVAGVYFSSYSQPGQWNPAGRLNTQLSTSNVLEVDAYLKKSYAGGFTIEFYGGMFDVTGDASYWQTQLNTTFDF